MPPRRRGRGRGQIPEESDGQTEGDQSSFPRRGRGRQAEDEVDELAARVNDMELVMARWHRVVVQWFRERNLPSLCNRLSQPQQQQQVTQQFGHQRFRPRGKKFKKKSGSSSSGSDRSSSGGTKVEYCVQCGGKHPTAQCVGVHGSCNVCGQYGHFARVCPLSGSQHTAVPP
ncbi:hypothetical protein F511_17376 [Dorcoceras hygrometricum]|uniref:CCHC-type domain-containing protein n=1 Tax=Dorcoceras hygrometricum TaxID=472368 RepID=A0A2Z7B1H1_9LAMI|nr:hypothetical protein F511_17376 [Dorcoceras hygrometricum]